MLRKFFKDEGGQGMTEYILIIALIAVVCIAGIQMFGGQISQLIVKSTQKIKQGIDDSSFNN